MTALAPWGEGPPHRNVQLLENARHVIALVEHLVGAAHELVVELFRLLREGQALRRAIGPC